MAENEQMNSDGQPSGGGGQKAVWIVVAIIIAALIAWFAMSKKADNGQELKSDRADSTQGQKSGKGESSFRELMAKGGSQKCSVGYYGENGAAEGTMYIADGMMRGDFSSTVNGKAVMSHMISDKSYIYSWSDMAAEGVKMKIATDQETSASSAASSGKPTNLDTSVSYDCQSWTKESMLFTPPSNVIFKDFSAMMQGAAGVSAGSNSGSGSATAGASGSADIKAQQCATCDSLAGEQKTQCKAALSCP